VGRRRKTGKHLPRGMMHRHGGYYFVYYEGGKQRWRKLSSDYGEALRLYADLVGKKREITTVEEAMTHCVALWDKKLAEDTIKGYTASSKRLIPPFGKLKLDELKRKHVYEYMTTRGNVAANRDRAFLSSVYTHMLNSGLHHGENPCAGLRFRNPERARKRYVTDTELVTLVDKLPRIFGLMARWSYLTGMRESEMFALKISDGDKDRGVTYTPAKQRKAAEQETATIEWTDDLREVWKAAAGSRIGEQPLFMTAKKNHYTRNSFNSTWQRWKKKIGIPNLRWHDLRRKAGSDSVSDEAATELLNHSDGKVTRKHYRAKPKSVSPLPWVSIIQKAGEG